MIVLLGPPPPRAGQSLSALLSYPIQGPQGVVNVKKKKLYYSKGMKCNFCQRLEHDINFCPSLPTRPGASDRVSYVEDLLLSPLHRTSEYEGMSWEEAWLQVYSLGAVLNAGNPWADDMTAESHLRSKLGWWKAIGADRTVLSWIAYGVESRFFRPLPRVAFDNVPVKNPLHEAYIDKEQSKLLMDGLIREIHPREAHIVHPMHVHEHNGKLRLVDDKRFTNAYEATPSFKMQSLEKDVPKAVQPGYLLLTKDLEKAYYKVMMAKSSRKYQCRYWKGRYYECLCLLFGGTTAPFIFTKLCRPMVRFLGAILVSVVNFIDDWLFGAMLAEFGRLKSLVDKLFLVLGWVFNAKGEEGVVVKFLGYLVDSSKREFTVPSDKVERTVAVIKRLMVVSSQGREVRLDDLQSLLGTLGSMRLAIQSIPVWTRELFSPWKGGATFDTSATLVLNAPMNRELEMILVLLEKRNAGPFMSQQWEVDVFVDSSEIAWGATILGEEVGDVFPTSLIGTSSTLRELNGLLGCSRHPKVQALVRGKVVRWNLDSKPAVANLVKGGGPVMALCAVVKELWIEWEALAVNPTFRWLPRETMEMRRVDEASKALSFWLKPELQASLSLEFGREFFSVSYNQIANTIECILARRRRCALVIPRWEAKSWWPVLARSASAIVPIGRHCIIFVSTLAYKPVDWRFCAAILF